MELPKTVPTGLGDHLSAFPFQNGSIKRLCEKCLSIVMVEFE